MKKKSGLAGAVGVLLLFGATAAKADSIFCVTIKSASGQVFGGTATNPCANRIQGLTFDYGVTTPRDVSSARTAGRRVHKAVRITKEWDTASVHLFNALVRNESLATVVFDFFATSPTTGASVLDHTITLRNAVVTSIEHKSDAMQASKAGNRALENVEFAFQGIDIDDHKSKTSATDSMQAP